MTLPPTGCDCIHVTMESSVGFAKCMDAPLSSSQCHIYSKLHLTHIDLTANITSAVFHVSHR